MLSILSLPVLSVSVLSTTTIEFDFSFIDST